MSTIIAIASFSKAAYTAYEDNNKELPCHRPFLEWIPNDYPSLPPSPYLVTLLRSRAVQVETWPLTLDQPLPTIPVPLRPPDADAVLDLQAALTAIYAEAGYDLSIDYNRAPPPPSLDTEPHRAFHQESTADAAEQADRSG